MLLVYYVLTAYVGVCRLKYFTEQEFFFLWRRGWGILVAKKGIPVALLMSWPNLV